MSDIHDYDLYDLDFEEWCRRGREAFGLHQGQASDISSIYDNENNIPSEVNK